MKREKLETLIFLALGEASMCWSETPKGVFQSEKVKEIGNRLVDELQALTSVKSESAEDITTYQRLFDYMSKEHDVILLQTDMQEIARIVLHDFAQSKGVSEEEVKNAKEHIEKTSDEILKKHAIGFHIQAMKLGLFVENEAEWNDEYIPKIIDIAEKAYPIYLTTLNNK